jgi:alkaline phosphatase
MIGDGMGDGQRDAASLYAYGETGQLFMEQLPYRGTVTTSSLSGVTDSAASATAMATGAITWNGVVGMDRNNVEVQSLVELAMGQGMAAGVVTTAEVTHATPAAFTAHEADRNNGTRIADDQAALRPEVLLGGGSKHYLPQSEFGSQRNDDGLIDPLLKAGCAVVFDAESLAMDDGSTPCLFGLFANAHLEYMVDRFKDTTEPTLSEMTMAALERLDQDPDGFILVIEGARIDMAGHSNELGRVIGEMLEFDATVEAVSSWLDGRENALLLVTADHETGGLTIESPGAKGEYSQVSWRHREHTNTTISLFGSGASAAPLDAQALHHPWVYATVSAYIEDRAVVSPEIPLLPDGVLSDHRWRTAEQTQTTDFGAGYNQLDALTMDVSDAGLFIGVEGVFEWDNNAVMLLLDHDPGQGTGTASLSGALEDRNGTLETILSNVPLTAPDVTGFGADMAVLTVGGDFIQAFSSLDDMSGVRGTAEAYGAPKDLWWMTAGLNFADNVRVRGSAGTTATAHGVEMFVPWGSLYPEEKNGIPVDASVSIAAVLVNTDGTTLSNQALPPYSETPDSDEVALPGVVHFIIDSNSDGVPDGDLTPEILK